MVLVVQVVRLFNELDILGTCIVNIFGGGLLSESQKAVEATELRAVGIVLVLLIKDLFLAAQTSLEERHVVFTSHIGRQLDVPRDLSLDRVALATVLRETRQGTKSGGSDELGVVSTQVHDSIEHVLNRSFAEILNLDFQLLRVLLDMLLFAYFIIMKVGSVDQVLSHEERDGIGALCLDLLLVGETAIQKGLDARFAVFDQILVVEEDIVLQGPVSCELVRRVLRRGKGDQDFHIPLSVAFYVVIHSNDGCFFDPLLLLLVLVLSLLLVCASA